MMSEDTRKYQQLTRLAHPNAQGQLSAVAPSASLAPPAPQAAEPVKAQLLQELQGADRGIFGLPVCVGVCGGGGGGGCMCVLYVCACMRVCVCV